MELKKKIWEKTYGEAHLLMRLLPNFPDTKKYGPTKNQTFIFFTVFTEKTHGFWNSF